MPRTRALQLLTPSFSRLQKDHAKDLPDRLLIVLDLFFSGGSSTGNHTAPDAQCHCAHMNFITGMTSSSEGVFSFSLCLHNDL